MSESLTEKFVDALEKLESGGDVENIAALFAERCEIGNVTLSKPLQGADGAKEFWTHYQRTLGDVRSVFKNKIVADKRSALEWTTRSAGGDEQHVSYEGVSIIESDGEKITRFFAYFNPNKLGNQLSKEQHG